jgi:hypothetical protein
MLHGSISAMTISLLFWVIYLLCVVFSVVTNLPVSQANSKPLIGSVIVFVLIGLLGWQVFGAAVHK